MIVNVTNMKSPLTKRLIIQYWWQQRQDTRTHCLARNWRLDSWIQWKLMAKLSGLKANFFDLCRFLSKKVISAFGGTVIIGLTFRWEQISNFCSIFIKITRQEDFQSRALLKPSKPLRQHCFHTILKSSRSMISNLWCDPLVCNARCAPLQHYRKSTWPLWVSALILKLIYDIF